jgi:hypothetical protein
MSCSIYVKLVEIYVVDLDYLIIAVTRNTIPINNEHSLTLLLFCPYLCCHSFLRYCLVSLRRRESVQVFYRLYIHVLRLRSSYQEGIVEIALTGLPSPYLCACAFSRGVFCVQWVQWRWKVLVWFVDIDRIDDHHCIHFMFITICFIRSYWL